MTASGLEAEVEGRLILDKRMGSFVAALNVVGEHAWSLEAGPVAQETELEVDAGVAWHFAPSWSVALEARNVNLLGAGGNSVLFAGPTLAYAAGGWWAALSVQPQLVAARGATDGSLNLDDHERVEARLLLGFHL